MAVAGTDQQTARLEAVGEIAEAERVDAVLAVDQRVGARPEPGKEIDLVQQGRVLNDQRVGLGDRFAAADRSIGEAAEGDDRRPGPLRSEAWEGLGVAALVEGGDREQLGGRDHPLASTAMDPHLEHDQPYGSRVRHCHPGQLRILRVQRAVRL